MFDRLHAVHECAALLQPSSLFVGQVGGLFLGAAQLLAQQLALARLAGQFGTDLRQLLLCCVESSFRAPLSSCLVFEATGEPITREACDHQFLLRVAQRVLMTGLLGRQMGDGRLLLAERRPLRGDVTLGASQILFEARDALFVSLPLLGSLRRGRVLVMLELNSRLRQLAVERFYLGDAVGEPLPQAGVLGLDRGQPRALVAVCSL